MPDEAKKRGRRREPIVLAEPKFIEMTPERHSQAVQAVAALLASAREQRRTKRDAAD